MSGHDQVLQGDEQPEQEPPEKTLMVLLTESAAKLNRAREKHLANKEPPFTSLQPTTKVKGFRITGIPI
jgi:hypothetical protein